MSKRINNYNTISTSPSIQISNTNTLGNLYTTGGNIGINTITPNFTLDISGTTRITNSLTTGSLFSNNILVTNTSTGTLQASTGIISNLFSTTATIPNVNITSNLNMTGGNINMTGGNINISGANFNLSTLSGIIISGGNIITNGITSSNLFSTTATIPNLISTNTSTGTISATSSTIPNIVSTNISAGTLRSTDLFLSGTLTTVNITTQNLLVTSNSSTLGSLLVSSGNLNMSGGSLNISGGSVNISGGTLNVSGNISSASVVSGNVFTGSTLQISGTTSTGNLVGTTATISNLFSTSITTSNLLVSGGNINISGANFNLSTPSGLIISSGNLQILGITSNSLLVAGNTRIINTTTTSATLNIAGPGSTTYLPSTTTIGSLASFYGPSGVGIISNFDLSTFAPQAGSSYLPAVRFSMTDLGNANSTFNILTKIPNCASMGSRIMIDGSGNVGINTTSPAFILDVSGSTRITTINTSASLTVVVQNNASSGGAQSTNGSAFLGYVSNGVAGASLNFDLSTFLPSITNGIPTTRFNITDLGSANNSLNILTKIPGGASMGSRIFIDGSGNVGINTTSPSYTLDINGSSTTFQAVGTQNTSFIPNCVLANNSSVSGAAVASFLTPNMVANNYNSLAYFGKSLSVGNSTQIAYSYIGNNNPSNLISINHYGLSGGIFLLNNGNVGIGTTSPSDILQVSNVMLMASSGNLTVTGDVLAFGTISDQRLKENVTDISTGLETICALRPVTFNWKQDIFNKNRAGTRDSGFIAQEVEQVLEHAVSEYTEIESGEKYKNMRHERIIPYLVKAIQELTQQVKELRNLV